MTACAFAFFDLGRVLLAFDHELACLQIAEVASLDPNTVRRVVFESGLELKYERGELTTAEFYEHFCRETSTTPDRQRLVAAAGNIFSPNEPVLQIAREVSAKLPLGVLSNTCEAHWDDACMRFPLLGEVFTHHVLSYEVRSLKPEPEIYAAAEAVANVPPEAIFFVDDMPENVAGARRRGWDAVQFSSPAQLRLDLEARALLDRDTATTFREPPR